MEATDDLIGSKIANKIIKVSKNLQQNNSETVTNENDNETPKEKFKERYISPEERQKIKDYNVMSDEQYFLIKQQKII